MNILSFSLVFFLSIKFVINTDNSIELNPYEYDPNGYVFFCLCMGRFGNQAEHFLGGMSFAELINRTLIIPPFRTYKNVPFSDWFRLDKFKEYHKSIPAEDFMKYIAPQYWPKGKRIGFCWLHDHDPITNCKMKEGNPFGPFWDELGVDFDFHEKYNYDYLNRDLWLKKLPASKYPVLALKGAPAAFPMHAEHRKYQKYLTWSDSILDEVNAYIKKNFGEEKFIGIHLRNGLDWSNACQHVGDGVPSFMASPQCLENTNKKVTKDICFPNQDLILRKIGKIVKRTNITKVYVATDKNPMINEIENFLKKYSVKVYHNDPWLPVIDVAILGQSDYFIGNCVSSFTSFVKRERDINNKKTEFWGI